ncbi:hypothetical protein GOODEAATRI_032451 [Goodea atripinnis]|uniref:Transposase n=1 Tax=Goodea atripinnis TaxID=208336 RepID=A0ABV0PJ86_9TELE
MDHWKKKARRSEKHDHWIMFCQDTLNLVHLDALRCCNLSKSPSSLKTYSLMEVASRRKRLSAKPQKRSQKGLKNLNPIKDPWCVLDKKRQAHGDITSQLPGPKGSAPDILDPDPTADPQISREDHSEISRRGPISIALADWCKHLAV